MSKLLEIKYEVTTTVEGTDNETTTTTIESFDVTPFIVLNTYSISDQSECEKWTDGNGKERRGLIRRRLKGSFSVKFFNQKDYQDFLSAVIKSRDDGFDYLTVNAYDNKSRTYQEDIEAYFDFEPINVEPSIGWSFNEEIEIEFYER